MVITAIFRRRAPLLSGLVMTALLTGFLLNQYLPRELVLLVIGAGLAVTGIWLAVAKQKAVYMLLVAVLPLEATFVIEAGFSVTPYYLVMGLLLLSYLVHNQRLQFTDTPSRLFAVYLIVCAVSLVAGMFAEVPHVQATNAMAWRASTLRPLIQLVLTAVHILFFAVVLDRTRSREQIITSTKLYLWIGLGLGVLGCWQTLAVALDLPGKDFTQAFGAAADQGYQYGKTRFYSALISNFAPRTTFRESLHFSHYLVSFLPVALALAMYREQLPKLWRVKAPIALVVISFTALFLTMSRSGWLAFACAMAFMFCFLPRRRMIKATVLTVVVLLVAGLILRALNYFRFDLDLWELIQLRMDFERFGTDPRVIYLQTLWTTFLQCPLLGVGIGNYGIYGAARLGMDVVLSAHSIFLNALVETGVIGFLVLSSIIIHFFWTAVRAIRQTRGLSPYPLLVGVTAGVFAMTVQYCSYGDRPGFHFLFMLALGYALIRYTKENPLPSKAN